VQHICITIGRLSRYPFVLSQGLKNGCIDKVKETCGEVLGHESDIYISELIDSSCVQGVPGKKHTV
jgi:hypothetical protein